MKKLIDIARPIINSFFIFLMFFVPRNKEKQKKILIIKLEGLGDFIVFIPSLLKYKEIYPHHKITLLVDNSINHQIAKRYHPELIDELILLDAKKFSKNIFYRFSVSKQLYALNFDITINPLYYRRKISDFLVTIAKSRERITFAGYEIEHNDTLPTPNEYTRFISVPSTITNEFYRHKYFIQELANKKYENYSLHFPLQDEDLTNAKKILKEYSIEENKYVVIFPGAGRSVSKWEPEKFAAVANFLIENTYKVIICGSSMEKEIAEKIIHNVKSNNKANIINLISKTNVFTTAAIIKLAKFYVGNDSGPTHTAESIKQTIICPLGLGHFREFYPSEDTPKNIIVAAKNMNCLNDLYACAKDLPPGRAAPCVSNITVEQILDEVKKLI